MPYRFPLPIFFFGLVALLVFAAFPSTASGQVKKSSTETKVYCDYCGNLILRYGHGALAGSDSGTQQYPHKPNCRLLSGKSSGGSSSSSRRTVTAEEKAKAWDFTVGVFLFPIPWTLGFVRGGEWFVRSLFGEDLAYAQHTGKDMVKLPSGRTSYTQAVASFFGSPFYLAYHALWPVRWLGENAVKGIKALIPKRKKRIPDEMRESFRRVREAAVAMKPESRELLRSLSEEALKTKASKQPPEAPPAWSPGKTLKVQFVPPPPIPHPSADWKRRWEAALRRLKDERKAAIYRFSDEYKALLPNLRSAVQSALGEYASGAVEGTRFEGAYRAWEKSKAIEDRVIEEFDPEEGVFHLAARYLAFAPPKEPGDPLLDRLASLNYDVIETVSE